MKIKSTLRSYPFTISTSTAFVIAELVEPDFRLIVIFYLIIIVMMFYLYDTIMWSGILK